MTLLELYNVLEKAVDSGKSAIENDVFISYAKNHNPNTVSLKKIEESYIDEDGDLILTCK